MDFDHVVIVICYEKVLNVYVCDIMTMQHVDRGGGKLLMGLHVKKYSFLIGCDLVKLPKWNIELVYSNCDHLIKENQQIGFKILGNGTELLCDEFNGIV